MFLPGKPEVQVQKRLTMLWLLLTFYSVVLVVVMIVVLVFVVIVSPCSPVVFVGNVAVIFVVVV